MDVVTWAALIGAGGSIVAVITFWLNRGKAEAEAIAKAEAADSKATAALARADQLTAQFAEARIEFAREYARADSAHV